MKLSKDTLIEGEIVKKGTEVRFKEYNYDDPYIGDPSNSVPSTFKNGGVFGIKNKAMSNSSIDGYFRIDSIIHIDESSGKLTARFQGQNGETVITMDKYRRGESGESGTFLYLNDDIYLELYV